MTDKDPELIALVERAAVAAAKAAANSPPPRKYLTPAEAADYLRCRKTTLANKRSLGIGPRYVKIGGRVAYLQADLDAYVRGDLVAA